MIILNWNGKKYLEQFLPGVISNTLSPEISVVVADNGSDDGSAEWVAASHPEVTVVNLQSNHGYAGGYNRALREVTAEYYILLNSDVEVEHGWAERLTSFMEAHPGVGACQPKIRAYNNRYSFEYAGAAGGYIDRLGYPFCRGRIFDTVEEDHGQYDDSVDIFWASGSCMMVRGTAYQQCGGLDDSFFLHMEEIDLCWRMLKSGYRIVYMPGVTVWHLGGGTLGYGSPEKIYYNFRNSLIMLAKNLPSKHLRRTLLLRRLLDGVAAVRLLMVGGRQAARAVVRAHRDYRTQREAIRAYRATVTHHDSQQLPPVMMNKYLIYEYYIRGRKTFRQLKWN